MALLAVNLAVWLAASPSSPDVSTVPPPSDISLRLTPPPGGWTPVFGGAPLTVRVTGRPQSEASWGLVHGETVLARGKLTLDDRGAGALRATMPSVRHRTVCRLIMDSGAGTVEHKLVAFPASLQAISAERLASLRLGVVDSRGRLQKAFAAEGVTVEDLPSQNARDFFDGRLVVLSGYGDAARLRADCRRLDPRVRKGMGLLLLNPPTDWAGWGVTCRRMEGGFRGKVRLADPLGRVLIADDVGDGPWSRVLATDVQAAIRRVATVASEGAADDEAPSIRALVALRSLGKGWVAVSVVPETDEPYRNPVGRVVAGRLILWLAGRAKATDPIEEEITDE